MARSRRCHCGRGTRGCDEKTRLVIPGRNWEDYLQLAVTEIREYGATSTQVCRRLRALLEALLRAAPAERRPAVEQELARLAAMVDTVFLDPDSRALAQLSDRQGLGGRMIRPAPSCHRPASLTGSAGGTEIVEVRSGRPPRTFP